MSVYDILSDVPQRTRAPHWQLVCPTCGRCAKVDNFAPGKKHDFAVRAYHFLGRGKIVVRPAPVTLEQAEGLLLYLRNRVKESLEHLLGEPVLRESEALRREQDSYLRGLTEGARLKTTLALQPHLYVQPKILPNVRMEE